MVKPIDAQNVDMNIGDKLGSFVQNVDQQTLNGFYRIPGQNGNAETVDT